MRTPAPRHSPTPTVERGPRAARSSAQPSARFLLLDLARLVAAMAVVMYHFAAREHGQWSVPVREVFPALSQVSVYGFLGVQLFFVISGFVIFMSTEGRGPGRFVAARAARLFPAYWVAVVSTAVLLVWIAPQLDIGVTLPQVLVNLTMLQTPLGVPPVDGVYWTLWVEATFYAAITLLLWLGVRDRGMTWFIVAWPVVGLGATLLGSDRLVFLLAAEHAPWFAAGMCLYLMHRHGPSVARWLILALTAAIAVRQTLAFNVPGTEPYTEVTVSPVVAAVAAVAIIGAMTTLTLTRLNTAGRPWMIWAGALTYPLYLVHEYWGWWVIGLVDPVAGRWAALLSAIFVSLLLAWVIERLVERPVRPRMRRRLEQLLDRKGSA